jgi:hypothetical protein
MDFYILMSDFWTFLGFYQIVCIFSTNKQMNVSRDTDL